MIKTHQKKYLCHEAGFTLIEIVVAMVVMTLVILGALGVHVHIQQGSKMSFQRAVAIQDANQVIERMREAAAFGVFPTNVTVPFPNNGAVAGFTNLINETLTVTYTDRDGDLNPTNDNPLDATVTVAWLANGRHPVNKTLRTMITQRT